MHDVAGLLRENAMNVITGASGRIGGALACSLADRDGDHCVRAVLHRKRGLAAGRDIEWVGGDVRDKESLLSAFAGADVVFHLAALISVDGDMAGEIGTTNVLGTRNVAEAALECGVKRLIHFSSIHAFNQFPLDEPLDETRDRTTGSHRSAYDRSKADGENEVRRAIAQGLDAVILNPTGVIGPIDGRPSHMGQFFLDLYHRRLASLVAGGFDWVDVRDVVAAALAAESRGRCGENYILSGCWHSAYELGQLAQHVTGVRAPRLVLPMSVARAWAPFQVAWDRLNGRRPLYTAGALDVLSGSNRQISSAKARKELGFRSRPVADSVRDAYRWFEEQGHLDRKHQDD